MENKYEGHFCNGEEVWKPICKECKEIKKGVGK